MARVSGWHPDSTGEPATPVILRGGVARER